MLKLEWYRGSTFRGVHVGSIGMVAHLGSRLDWMSDRDRVALSPIYRSSMCSKEVPRNILDDGVVEVEKISRRILLVTFRVSST